ncbi:zinc finger protein [Culex quinquefasciatus]|uniref:Zinc finger protein n=1 Tax=Culex quinquefasciatus TaxID=7176 RepID=B0WHW5_CULQU|nr:zinc finger protein [Culex quinquefasciatus]|eukprot:XP_001848298.1 zinc finger protein [Culex quinquefasciatus]
MKCSVCGKSFADRSNMTLHHRLHSGVKPFACPVCPKAFTKKHHLKTHINYHTGHKPITRARRRACAGMLLECRARFRLFQRRVWSLTVISE